MKTCAKLFALGLLTVGAAFSGVRSSEAGVTGDLRITNNHDFDISVSVWRSGELIQERRVIRAGSEETIPVEDTPTGRTSATAFTGPNRYNDLSVGENYGDYDSAP